MIICSVLLVIGGIGYIVALWAENQERIAYRLRTDNRLKKLEEWVYDDDEKRN